MLENKRPFVLRAIQYLHRCSKTKDPLCWEQYNIYTVLKLCSYWQFPTTCLESTLDGNFNCYQNSSFHKLYLCNKSHEKTTDMWYKENWWRDWKWSGLYFLLRYILYSFGYIISIPIIYNINKNIRISLYQEVKLRIKMFFHSHFTRGHTILCKLTRDDLYSSMSLQLVSLVFRS